VACRVVLAQFDQPMHDQRLDGLRDGPDAAVAVGSRLPRLLDQLGHDLGEVGAIRVSIMEFIQPGGTFRPEQAAHGEVGGDGGATILDNALSSRPQLVQIQPTDTAFKTSGCQPWLAANDQTPSPDAPPWLAQLQLRHYLDVLNGLAGQSGNGQLPPS